MKDILKRLCHRDSIMQLTLIIVLCLMPMKYGTNSAVINLLVSCLFYAAFGVSWNIIAGYGGQTSYCHCAFISIGAYTGAIFFTKFGISPWVTMPLGVALSVIFATFMGKACFRYRGPFFGITTIAFAELLRITLLVCDNMTGYKITNGSRGITIVYKSQSFYNLQFKTDIPFLYIMLALLILCIITSALFIRSKNGYYLRTIRADEDAAISLGIDTGKVKLRAFQLSAAMVTVVGMVYAFFVTYIEPQTICGADMMIRIAAIGYLGGNNRLTGPVLGAFIMLPLISASSLWFGAMKATNFFYGLALILIILFAPDGLIPLTEKTLKKFADRIRSGGPDRIELRS